MAVSKKLKAFFRRFLLNRKNSLLENIVLCLAITLASAFFQYDYYYFFMDILRAITSVLLLVTWLWCGFISGRDKKWGFLIFAGVYWLVPFVYILWYDSVDILTYEDAFPMFLYRWAYLLFRLPLLTVAQFTECDVYIWIVSLVILTFTVYFIGVNAENILRDRNSSEDT